MAFAPSTADTTRSPNGGTTAVEPKSAEKKRVSPHERRQTRYAQSFAQIIGVLMRDPNFRNLRLADLEWLVLPPIMAGQWRLGQGPSPTALANADPKNPEGVMLVPMAVALWARVSPEVEKQLMENLDKPLTMRANEWASGDNIWLVAAAGDRRYVPTFLQKLNEIEFTGKHVKMRSRGADGTPIVTTLSDYLAVPAQPAKGKGENTA